MELPLKKKSDGTIVAILPTDLQPAVTPLPLKPKAPPTKPVKPGWQSTEFWVTIVTSLISVLAAGGYISPADAETATGGATQIAGLIGLVVAQVGYSVSRGNAKK